MTRDEAQGWFVELLLDKVRTDRYPSMTQLDMIEETIPPQMLEEYLDILIEKVGQDQWPSITMLRRIQRVTASIPREGVGA
jgi:hypothetical protein